MLMYFRIQGVRDYPVRHKCSFENILLKLRTKVEY